MPRAAHRRIRIENLARKVNSCHRKPQTPSAPLRGGDSLKGTIGDTAAVERVEF